MAAPRDPARPGVIVADASVISLAFIKGDRTEEARAAKEQEPDWRVPRLWREEFANVLVTHVRTGHLPRGVALGTMDEASRTLSVGEMEVSSAAAIELAVDRRLSAYDAHYLALARQLGTVCLTADLRLRKAVPELTQTLAEFLSAPAKPE